MKSFLVLRKSSILIRVLKNDNLYGVLDRIKIRIFFILKELIYQEKSYKILRKKFLIKIELSCYRQQHFMG